MKKQRRGTSEWNSVITGTRGKPIVYFDFDSLGAMEERPVSAQPPTVRRISGKITRPRVSPSKYQQRCTCGTTQPIIVLGISLAADTTQRGRTERREGRKAARMMMPSHR